MVIWKIWKNLHKFGGICTILKQPKNLNNWSYEQILGLFNIHKPFMNHFPPFNDVKA
jgi:hypothetical protein